MREKQNSAEYQETKQHGSRLFPFNIYPCTIPLDFPVVSLHWHKEMELIYVKKGKGESRRYFCGDSGYAAFHSQNKRICHGVRKYYL